MFLKALIHYCFVGAPMGLIFISIGSHAFYSFLNFLFF